MLNPPPAGVLPAQDSGLQPGVGAVLLQRLSEGDGPVGVRRSHPSPVRARRQRHQHAVSAHLHASRYGKKKKDKSEAETLYPEYVVKRLSVPNVFCRARRWSTRPAAEASSSPSAT